MGILRYMNIGNFQEAWVGAMHEMHENGQGWLGIFDIAQHVAVRDEKYMRRYRRINRVLSVVGVKRPDEPPMNAPLGKIIGTLARLETIGTVEARWEYPDAPQGEHGKRQYRLVPPPQEQPAPTVIE